jgi:hypothetical protein
MRTILTLLLTLVFGTIAFSYQLVLKNDQITSSTKNYAHLDKVVYNQGDDLWFKIYLIDKTTNLLLSQDTKINIELLDAQKNSIAIKSVLVSNGLGYGNIRIPNEAMTGKYTFIAHNNHSNSPNKAPLIKKEVYLQNTHDSNVHSLSFEQDEYGSGDLVSAIYRGKFYGQGTDKVSLKYEVWSDTELILEGLGTNNTSDPRELTIQFKLPEEIIDGNYVIRLTSFNKDDQFTSSHKIPYIRKIDLQFFPEGGHLVSGIENNLAFKAIDNNGRPVEVEGYLTNLTNGQKTPFKSYYQGMGQVNILPATADKFEVSLTKPENIETDYVFPDLKNIGYSMLVDNSQEEHLMINLMAHEHSQDEEVVIAIVAQNQTYWLNEEYIGEELSLKISKSKFPAGIVKIIAFDIDNTPILERIVFVNKKRPAEIATDMESYSIKQMVNIKIKTGELETGRTFSNLSLAVTDERFSTSSYIPNTNILSQLLLSSELKGTIPTPGYYFNSKSLKTLKALDLVMLTNGWRSYSWQDIMNKTIDIEVNDFTFNELISGQVLYKNGKPASFEKIQIINKLNWQIVEVTTDDLGNFYYGTQFTSEMKDGFFVTFPESNKKVDISLFKGDKSSAIASIVSLESKKTPTETSLESSNKNNSITNIDDARILEEVVINDRKEHYRKVAESTIANHSLFSSVQVQKVSGNKFNAISSSGGGNTYILSWIRQATPVTYVNKPQVGNITLRGAPDAQGVFSGGAGPALFVVDGFPIGNDYRQLNYLSGDEIESIEVIRSSNAAVIYGTHAAGGVVIFNTKKSQFSDTNNKSTNSLNTVSVTTLSQNKTFYSPKYEQAYQINDITPDLRTTLHWEPNIVTDEHGEATISFYTGDFKTNYIGILEGVDPYGNITYEHFYINVK